MSRTREKVVQCAYELFGRSGFHAVGLDSILNEAGISKQTFYNHFESKDDLILTVLRHRHETESATFHEVLTAVAGEDPRDRLYGIFDALDRWFKRPEWRGCIFMRAASEFPNRHDPAHVAAREHADAVREYLQALAAEASAADPAAAALQLTLLIEGVVGLHHLSGEQTLLAAAKQASHRLLDEQFAVAAGA